MFIRKYSEVAEVGNVEKVDLTHVLTRVSVSHYTVVL